MTNTPPTPGGAPAAPAGPPGGLPLPPGFPPGVDPATFRLEEVTALLEAAAYFPLAAVPGAGGGEGLAAGVRSVRLDVPLHRLRLGAEAGDGGPPLPWSCLDGSAARLTAELRPMPEDFVAATGRPPPPTALSPDRPQRFGLYGFELAFGVGHHGVAGFGTGRTFPRARDGVVPWAAVVEVASGWGRFAGLTGAVVLDGTLGGCDGLTVQAVVRMMDPERRVTTRRRVPPGRSRGETEGSVTLALLGEPDPQRPVELITGPGGRPVGSRVYELLRLVDLDFSINQVRPRARSSAGPVVGDLEAVLIFNPLSQAPVVPIQTRRGVFRLSGGDGSTVGTVAADMVEGRGFPTPLPGAPVPVFRFAGFGPVQEGTGTFAGATGMMTMNSVISVFPRTLSNLYLLRLADPDGRLRGRCGKGWG